PSGGTVCLDGVPLARLGRRRVACRLAVVPQEMHVPFAFTVREVVALGRTAHVPFLHGESTRDRQAVERALRLLELEPLAARPYNSLSGGERQRAVLAMALAQEPRVLLLDEPTVHLDPAHQRSTLALVGRLARERGLTAVAVLHDLNLVGALCERVVVLDRGRVVADGI